MKWFTTILAVFLLVLSMLPCSDAFNRCEEPGPVVQTTQTHDHKADQDDNCPPFCRCMCCSVQITAFDFLSPTSGQLNEVFSPDKTPIRAHFLLSGYSGNVFHPPKA